MLTDFLPGRKDVVKNPFGPRIILTQALSGNPREILRVCLQASYDLSGKDSSATFMPRFYTVAL